MINLNFALYQSSNGKCSAAFLTRFVFYCCNICNKYPYFEEVVPEFIKSIEMHRTQKVNRVSVLFVKMGMAGSSQCGKTSSHVASGSIRGALKTFELQQQQGRTSDAVRIAFGYCFSGLSLVLKKVGFLIRK